MDKAQNFVCEMAESISIPQIYLDIRQLIKQHSTIDAYVNLIQNDSMLTLRILRISNSSFFGFSRKVDTLHQALTLIGIIQLHDLLLVSLCIRLFTAIPSQILNLKEFWRYGVQCGIASRIIAQHSFIPISNHYFTLGLIHEIGHAAMYCKEPDLSTQCLEQSQIKNIPIQQVEDQIFGFNYTQVGHALMQLWHLPDSYQQVASFHLAPELAEEKYQFEVQLVHLAHTICQIEDNKTRHKLISDIRKNVPELKHIPDNIEAIIINEVKIHSEEVLNILWPNTAQEILLDDGVLNNE